MGNCNGKQVIIQMEQVIGFLSAMEANDGSAESTLSTLHSQRNQMNSSSRTNLDMLTQMYLAKAAKQKSAVDKIQASSQQVASQNSN